MKFYQRQKNGPHRILVPMKSDREICGEENNFQRELKRKDPEAESGQRALMDHH